MRAIVALACTGISASIGYAYVGEVWVSGWQLWLWMICVLMTAVCLMPAFPSPVRISTKIWGGLLALFGVALALRITFLERVPGGLHVDEMGVADFALRHVFAGLHQTLNPFRTGPVSQPALYHYLIRLSLALVGNSITGLRISSAWVGALAVLATYAAVAGCQNHRTGVLCAVIMATYHYHVHWSRIGLNNVWDTLWVPATLAAFVWGWRLKWSGGAVLAGLGLGLSQYFYAGSKVGLFLLAYLAWHVWRGDRDGQRLVSHLGKLTLVAVCVAAPLVLFAVHNPAVYLERPRIVFGWQYDTIVAFSGEPVNYMAYAWRQLWRALGAFTTVPDVTGFYGPGVPFAIGVAAPLFLIGFGWALRERLLLPVLWVLLTALLGGFLLTGVPSSSHYVVSIPAICWLIATPLDWLMGRGYRRVAWLLLLAIVATDLLFYFGVYVPGGPRDLINPFPGSG